MASRAFDMFDEQFPARDRPALRLVETAPASKLLPPAWLVAPAFRAPTAVSVHEEQQAYQVAVAKTSQQPYQNSRQVPRHS